MFAEPGGLTIIIRSRKFRSLTKLTDVNVANSLVDNVRAWWWI